MFLRTHAKFATGAVKRNFCRSIWTLCTTCAISLLPGIIKVKKNSTVEREYSKTKKNHQKLITKRKRKAPYLTQYTEIDKVIKRFRTATFTDLHQWQFVLKLSGYVSFIILNLFTQKEEKLTKMCSDILSENKYTQKVAGRLTFDLLTQSLSFSSRCSSIVGIWSKKSLHWKPS